MFLCLVFLVVNFINITLQENFKQNLNVVIEHSFQRDFHLICFNEIAEYNEITFKFNKQEILIEKDQGKVYVRITNEMVDECDGYVLNSSSDTKDLRLQNCTAEITSKSHQNEVTDSFHFNYIHVKQNASPYQFLNYLEYPCNDYEDSTSENFYVFPNILKTHFSYEECLSTLCDNSGKKEFITIHDEYNFKVNIQPQDILDKYELILQRVTLTGYNKSTNEFIYAREVTNLIKVLNSTYSLPTSNLPERFDLQMNYVIKTKPNKIVDGENETDNNDQNFKVRIL